MTNEKLDHVKKITVGEMIENVLNDVEMRPYEEGALIMFHFLNGILVGGNIDIDKCVKTNCFFAVEKPVKESSLEEWIKQNLRPRSGPRQEGESTSKA